MGIDTAKSKYRQARQAWESGERDTARSLYLESIAADDTFPLPHYDLGAMLEPSDPSEARRHYASFVELGAGDEKLISLVGQATQKLAALPDSAESTQRRPEPSTRAPRTAATDRPRRSTRIRDYPLLEILWGLLVIFGGLVVTLNWVAASSSDRDVFTVIFGVFALGVGVLLAADGILKWALRRRRKK